MRPACAWANTWPTRSARRSRSRTSTSLCRSRIPRARLNDVEYLADKIRKVIPVEDIDLVMPIPDSSRPAAIQLALKLGVEYREGFIKNRYIGRTFIMPGQGMRKKSVRQ